MNWNRLTESTGGEGIPNNKDGSLDSTQWIDQFKTSKTRNNKLSTELIFSEPLSKKLSAWLSYQVLVNSSNADISSLDKSFNGKYDDIDSSLSNKYQFNQLYNNAGTGFMYKYKKTDISTGTRAAYVNYKQSDLYSSLIFKRNFINWTPRFSYRYSMSNNVLNTTHSYTYRAGFGISKYEKSHEFYISVSPSYNVSQSSLQKLTNNNGAVFRIFSYYSFTLPAGFDISGESSYEYTAKTEAFNDNLDRLLLNLKLTKSFFKDKSLKVAISGNDLFNQNTGFSRLVYGNVITQQRNTTIKRFVLFSLIYDFSKMGGAPSK